MSVAQWFKGIRLRRPPAPAAPPSEAPAPERVCLPLRQHRGDVCEPQVQPGDQVALGQIIGSSESIEAALVHATVSGKVEQIIDISDAEGHLVPTVVIQNDGKDTWAAPGEDVLIIDNADQVMQTKPSRLLKAIRQAGLVRAAAHGLPLHAELSPPMAPRSYLFMTGIPVVRSIDTLIVKALDADLPIMPNQAGLVKFGPELEIGVAAVARICGAQKVIIAAAAGAELGDLPAIAKAREWSVSQIAACHYPYGLDGMVVNALTGREVPTPYGEPRDVGVLIEPLSTVLDVGRTLLGGRPVIDRLFTVAGDVARPQTFKVRLGTPLADVLKAAGGPSGQIGKAIIGGPMMGMAHFDLNTPVTKESDGLFVLSLEKVQTFSGEPCIHCGRCVQACPVNLVPAELGKLCEYGLYEDAADKDLMHCIECGCCAYVCPAKRPMVHLLRLGKTEILARRAEL